MIATNIARDKSRYREGKKKKEVSGRLYGSCPLFDYRGMKFLAGV